MHSNVHNVPVIYPAHRGLRIMNMKKFLPVFLVVFSPVVFGPWAMACESLQGAWKLEYAVYKDQQGKMVYEIKGDSDKSIKILSQEHFSFITQSKDGKFSAAGAGTYTLKDDAYTEVVSYASLDRLMGKTYHFKCQLKEGIWIHSGDEDGVHIEEHWKRVP
jgi:hypothetical protein